MLLWEEPWDSRGTALINLGVVSGRDERHGVRRAAELRCVRRGEWCHGARRVGLRRRVRGVLASCMLARVRDKEECLFETS